MVESEMTYIEPSKEHGTLWQIFENFYSKYSKKVIAGVYTKKKNHRLEFDHLFCLLLFNK